MTENVVIYDTYLVLILITSHGVGSFTNVLWYVGYKQEDKMMDYKHQTMLAGSLAPLCSADSN